MTRTPILVIALALSFPDPMAAGADQVQVKKFRVRPIASIAGKDMYREYCARCHGENGRGDGPDAPGLRKPPADLTTLAQRHGGRFEPGGVRDKINGFQLVPRTRTDANLQQRAEQTGENIEHAPIMPIWGPIFAKLYPDLSERTMRLTNLVNYLQSIQVKQ